MSFLIFSSVCYDIFGRISQQAIYTVMLLVSSEKSVLDIGMQIKIIFDYVVCNNLIIASLQPTDGLS